MAKKYTYQNKGIFYSNVTRPSTIMNGRLGFSDYEENIDFDLITEIPNKTINAIDIDWNGAYLSSLNTYINDTSDVLNQFNMLSYTMASYYTFLDNKFDNYYSKSYIDNIIGTDDESNNGYNSGIGGYDGNNSGSGGSKLSNYVTYSYLSNEINTLNEDINKKVSSNEVYNKEEVDLMIRSLQSTIQSILSRLDTIDSNEGYYLWMGNFDQCYPNNYPDQIDSNNAIKIKNEDIENGQIIISTFIIPERLKSIINPNNIDIRWAFTLPKEYDYQFVSTDQPDFDYGELIMLDDNNYLNKYKLYHITAENLNVVLTANIIRQ